MSEVKLMSRVHWTKYEIKLLKETISNTPDGSKQQAIRDFSALIGKTVNGVGKKWHTLTTKKMYKPRGIKITMAPEPVLLQPEPKTDKFSGSTYPTSLMAYLFKQDSFNIENINIDVKGRRVIINY